MPRVYSQSRYREKWFSEYDIVCGKEVGELYDSDSRMIKTFDVMIKDNKFTVSVGSSGAKIVSSRGGARLAPMIQSCSFVRRTRSQS